jgi:hypothetical protein
MPDGRSPAVRDRFLRRPQRPGCPQRLHALGTASAIYLVRSPVNLSAHRELGPFACCRTTFTITGSATFTLAVMELSRISFLASMKNRKRAVRILWTMGLPCGKAWKRREEIEFDAQILNLATRDCVHLRVLLLHILRCISFQKPRLDRVLCRPLKRTPVVNMPVPALTCWARYVPPLRAAGHRSRSFRNEQKSAEQRCKNCGSHHD